jgi:hypothetical protein
MIKNKLVIVALVATTILLPAAARAAGLEIQIGDRPFYNHGPRYWAGDTEMVWVPGHMSRHHWVHGQYIRGEHRRHNMDRRHDERLDDRRNDYRDESRR